MEGEGKGEGEAEGEGEGRRLEREKRPVVKESERGMLETDGETDPLRDVLEELEVARTLLREGRRSKTVGEKEKELSSGREEQREERGGTHEL